MSQTCSWWQLTENGINSTGQDNKNDKSDSCEHHRVISGRKGRNEINSSGGTLQDGKGGRITIEVTITIVIILRNNNRSILVYDNKEQGYLLITVRISFLPAELLLQDILHKMNSKRRCYEKNKEIRIRRRTLLCKNALFVTPCGPFSSSSSNNDIVTIDDCII